MLFFFIVGFKKIETEHKENAQILNSFENWMWSQCLNKF
jgi:hypothetical protein